MSEPAAVQAKATLVRLFEDRAEVTRECDVDLQAGNQWVRLAGPSLFTDDRSVQAQARQARVLAARVVRTVRHESTRPEAELAPLRKQLGELNEQIARAWRRHQLAQQQVEFARSVQDHWAEGFGALPTQAGGDGIEPWRTSHEQTAAEDDRASEALQAIDDELQDLNEQQAKLQAEYQQGSAIRTIRECFIDVQLDSRGGNDHVSVSYRTPGALWRPEHAADLQPDPKHPRAGQVEWRTFAVVWQHTGEDWRDVELRCSTARPAAVSDSPLLEDDVLEKRKKTPEEKKQVVVEVREQAVNTAAARAEPQMPGVDDGGKPVEYAPHGRWHIPSDGKPLRIELGTTRMPAIISRALLPEKAAQAHVRATLQWGGSTPLLAGPLAISRNGALVGRARTGFAAVGEQFMAGFGPEDSVRCKRNLHEYHETAKITGAQKVVREVTLNLSNLSGNAIELDVTERLPVSEIEGLEIVPTDIKGWKHDEKDGYLTQTIKLEAAANTTLKFGYEIRAKSNVVLPF